MNGTTNWLSWFPLQATAETGITFAAIGCSIAALLMWRPRYPWREAAAFTALLLGILSLRLLVTRPTLLHASFHPLAILDSAIASPTTSLRNYGPFSFMVLGALMRIFGPRLDVIATAGQIESMATLGLMAWLAFRLSGDRLAALAVLSLGALSPPLVRVAASEDSHTLAVFLGWLGLACMEGYVREPRLRIVVLGVSATVLMLVTRQTLFVLAPCIPLYAVLRSGGVVLRQRPFVLGAITIVAVFVYRVAVSVDVAENAFQLSTFVLRLSHPSVLLSAVLHHPMLGGWRYGPYVLLLEAIGFAWLWRHSPAGRFLVLVAAGLFVWMLPVWEGLAVQLTFRLPAVSFGYFAAGLGAWRLLARTAARLESVRGAAVLQGALLLLLGLAPTAFPGWRTLGQATTVAAEFEYIVDHARDLPPAPTIVLLRPETGSGEGLHSTTPNAMRPAYYFPSRLFALLRPDAKFREFDQHDGPDFSPSEAPVFLQGAQCAAYSLPELMGLGIMDILRTKEVPLALLAGRIPAGVRVPTGVRPECERILRGAVLLTAPRVADTSAEEAPFLLYGRDKIVLQFMRLDPDALR